MYFISETKDKNKIYIGFSTNPVKKMYDLQDGNYKKLIIINIIEADPCQVTEIQSRFAYLRITGNWFQNTGELKNFIESQPIHPLIKDTNSFQAILEELSTQHNQNSSLNKYDMFVKKKILGNHKVKLSNVSNLEDFDTEMQLALKAFYNSRDINKRYMGSILNAIYTQESGVFINSVRTMKDLILLDPNHLIKTFHFRNYNDVMHMLQSNNIIRKLRAPRGRRAGLYKLIADVLLQPLIMKIGEELLETKELLDIEWYDSHNVNVTKTNKEQKEDDFVPNPEIQKILSQVKKKRESNG